MKVLFEVSSGEAADVFLPLALACNRGSVTWGCFFTGDGVKTLGREDVLGTVKGSAAEAAVCEVSWERHMGEEPCPVDKGSQTTNSGMVGNFDKVVSL